MATTLPLGQLLPSTPSPLAQDFMGVLVPVAEPKDSSGTKCP